MTSRSVRIWSWLHRWSSLVCTLFMLLLCLTGLPLIFSDEIDALTRKEVAAMIRRSPKDRIFVVDEAYCDFGGESCIPLLAEFDNHLLRVSRLVIHID